MATTDKYNQELSAFGKAVVHGGDYCNEWMRSDAYGKENYKQTLEYKACCEDFDYCAFYRQPWFWGVCGGVILLLIIASIVGSFFCCCRRRGGGGMEQKNSDEDASEPSDSDKSTMNNPA